MKDVKSYKPETNSISSGQVLHCPYDCEKSRLVLKEMADQLSLDLVSKHLVTKQLVITVGYDIENLSDPEIRKKYKGPVTIDYLGRRVPKHAHGTINLSEWTASTKLITEAAAKLYDEIINPVLLVRRFNITATMVKEEKEADTSVRFGDQVGTWEQMDLFTDYEKLEKEREKAAIERKKEKKLQEAALALKQKFGKNAVLKGMNLQEGATMKGRNEQIGGHKA